MKYLQDLVPGCSKVTGKAVMLDEIINYVQSIQRQVEVTSCSLGFAYWRSNPCHLPSNAYSCVREKLLLQRVQDMCDMELFRWILLDR